MVSLRFEIDLDNSPEMFLTATWLCLPTETTNSSLSSTLCMLSRFSRVRLFATRWTVAHQAPLSKEFSRQEHCSGLLFPSPGALPDPGTEPKSLKFPALAGGSLPRAPPGKPCTHVIIKYIFSSSTLLFLFVLKTKIQTLAGKM